MNNAQNTESKDVALKSPVALREEAILNFWNQNEIFKKSLEKDSPLGDYVFYDGPPFATGTPHYGHILAGTMKDAIPRYRTMRGYRVDRRWGWDCHGLPVENLVEKEYNLSSKLDIEKMGIANFNKAARNSVFKYADVWREMVPRFGRWVDMDREYKTMDPSYIETVWWVFNNLYNKKLIYEGFKSMHLCPHCETTLSNFEVASGYKDITDISVYVKFELEKEAGTYLIAWTTTPWTLPGNSALAINPKIDYLKIEIKGENGGKDEKYIFAKERLSVLESILKNAKKTFSVLEEIKGESLVGLSYKAIFPYYSEDKNLKNRNNGWKVYDADFVTTTDGTGIVHIAPAFGSDDYDLSLKKNIPFIQHVGRNGAFNKEVVDFASKKVKPKDTAENKDAHQSGDIEIIKYLAGKGSLLAKEKLVHSYPHCWRCETPLLNYASSSWFVKISNIKAKMLSQNKKIKWIPEAIGTGRFDNSIASAPDWAISRSRYWGAPLPVWRSEDGEIFVPKSIADLKTRIKRRNKYIVMRHGQAENNTKNILNGKEPFASFHLTSKGKDQVEKSAQELSSKFCDKDKIDLIIHSPFIRTAETAKIVALKLGIKNDFIIVDSRLSELNTGIFDNGPTEKYHQFSKKNKPEENFYKAPPLGESWNDVSMRMGQFIREIDSKYEGKNILIVTHDSPAWLLFVASENMDPERALGIRGDKEFFLDNASYKEIDFVPVPANENFCLDLHKPYIDEIKIYSKNGKEMKRVPEVFDCWFESGSMPYAEKNYLGIKQKTFDPKGGLFSKTKGFPADFIAEGQDQTRGWFYSMLVLGTALFGKTPYKNVIVNGLVLAEDGHKMSKSKNNYPDPKFLIDKYGMDAIRYYMLSSPVVSAEDLAFSEKGVDEVLKKVINRFDNVISFFEMYAKDNDMGGERVSPLQSKNVLDKWVIAKLKELSSIVTENMESYALNSASRPIAGFIDDLSTWYLRRSRDRFKSSGSKEDEDDKNYAVETTRYIIKEMSKIMAPFMPFFAEYAYGKSKEISDPESVHLCSWPESDALSPEEKEIIKNMDRTRKIVSIGLELRSSANIKVRQPLASLTVSLEGAYPDLIKDEVNVKEIIDSPIKLEETSLDKNITAELKEEGELREFLRLVQDLRKKNNLKPKDKIKLFFPDTNVDLKNIIEKNREEIKRIAGIYEIDYSGQEISLLII